MDESLEIRLVVKLLIPALVIAGGVIFVVKRLIVSSVEKSTAHRWIRKIQRNPSYARGIADGLDMPYGAKEGFLPEYYEKLKEYIGSRAMIGDYQVLFSTNVSSFEFLVFVLLSFDDFDVGITGGGTDVKKQSYLTFLLRHDFDAQRLLIYSDIYNTSIEKQQREGFFKAIFTGGEGNAEPSALRRT